MRSSATLSPSVSSGCRGTARERSCPARWGMSETADRTDLSRRSHRVRVEPSGHEFSVRDGETVMAGAQRHGYRWPTVCGGKASCGVCCLELKSGMDVCSPETAAEAERLTLLGLRAQKGGPRRLACQLTVHGPVVVHTPGVRLNAGSRAVGPAPTSGIDQ
jgi:ferredoxin